MQRLRLLRGQESSEEEREHAEKLMEYQNKHGGKVKLQSILMPLSNFDHADKGDALYGTKGLPGSWRNLDVQLYKALADQLVDIVTNAELHCLCTLHLKQLKEMTLMRSISVSCTGHVSVLAYGSFSIAEICADKILYWAPFYYHFKLSFLVWLQLTLADVF